MPGLLHVLLCVRIKLCFNRAMLNLYPTRIGLRYTSAKRSNHFISFISLTSMVGLIIGVALLITVLSVMNGFDRELQQRILGMVPHAVIKPYGNMRDWQSLDEQISAHPQVVAAAPFIKAQGMVTRNGSVNGVQLNGILPDEEDQVSIISRHMVQGRLQDLESGEFGIIVGEILARQLRLAIGDKVTVVLPEAALTPAGVFPRLKRFTVKGVFRVGADLDASLTLIHMDDAAKIMRMKGYVHGLRLKMHDLFDAPLVSRQLAGSLDQ
ncbi:MAG: ABC transporter permease, partial [Oleiphilaceae bacterium]|nr:ABC transporter permease [Oleiphilaceae bacterium]